MPKERPTRAAASSFGRRSLLQWASGLVVSGCAAASTPPRGPRAESLLIERARIHGRPDADAILVVGDAIAAVGGKAEIHPGTVTRTIDARGGLVVPGIHDAHAHVRSGGQMLGQAQLEGLTSLDAVLDAVRAYATAHPDDAWVLGRGWSYDIVPAGRFPTRADLDRVSGDRPIFLESYDGHAAWANSAALARAGVDASTADPQGGRIVREADGRTPEGALLEAAFELVASRVPPPTEAEERAALARAAEHLVRLGVTSVDDFAEGPEGFTRYAALEAANALPIRVWMSLPLDHPLEACRAFREHHRSPLLGFGYLKGFVDGVIESKTAFMLEPYAGDDARGEPLLPPDRLHPLVGAAHAAGFRVALHAIGDAAVRLALDAFERAGRPENGAHRVEHIEVVHPSDVPRFAALGVVASMQPYHAVPADAPGGDVWSENLGPDRLARAFAWKRLADADAALAFGSDWPVMTSDPLWGLAVALTRKNGNALPAGGWHADQCVSVDRALAAYGIEPARALGQADHLGTLAPGRLADLVVLAPHVRFEDPSTLWEGERIAQVIVGGRVVHDG